MKNPLFKEVINFVKYLRVSFSQHDILYIFIHFFNQSWVRIILSHLKLTKELNFYRLQNRRKIVCLRVKFFEPVPQLAHLSTCTFPNWHFPQLELFAIFVCSIENLSPPTAGTLFVFILCDIADSRKVVLIEHFFYF